MSMEYIRKSYAVPAKRGMRVRFMGREGIITGSDGARLIIKTNDQKRVLICHPTWEMEYLDN